MLSILQYPGESSFMSLLVIFNDLHHFATTVLLAVGALLPIVGPLDGAPIYLAMTSDLSPKERVRMAKSVAINSFILLVSSALIGAYVLDFLGLSIPIVQVAGGIVVCAIAWSLLNNPNSLPAIDRNEPSAVTPIAFQSARFLPSNDAAHRRSRFDRSSSHSRSQPDAGPSSVSRDCASACAWYLDRRCQYLPLLPLRRSHPQKLGPTGTSVVMRLSAFILLCIGVKIFWDGLHALLVGVFPNTAS